MVLGLALLLLDHPEPLKSFGRSLSVSSLAALIALVVGVPYAWVVSAWELPGRRLLTWVGVGPLVIPMTSTMVNLGTLPAGGVLTTTYAFPPVAKLVDSYYLQGLFVNASIPEVAFGTATQRHVLIPGF